MTEAPSSPLEYALAEAPEQTPINAGVPSRPPIDFEQARDFLAALAPGETDFTFQTFDDDDTRDEKRPELARVMHGPLTANFAGLSRLSARGAGVFVTVNRTDLKRRRKENVVAVRALFADLDAAPLAVLERLGLPPHIIAISSPERFHPYWLVKGVETTEFTRLQERLAALFGSDPSVCDLPRVMRLPGFPHQKNPDNPHMVWFQAREHSGPYEADAFRAALPAAGGGSGSKDNGLAGGGRAESRQGRDASIVAFPERAPTPEPWSEAGERRLRSALAVIPADNREVWLKIGFALYDVTAADLRWPGREMWDEWSSACPGKFDPAGQDKAWASFGRGYDGERVGLGTVYRLAKENGWIDPVGPLGTVRDDAALPAPKSGIDFAGYERTDAGNALAFLCLFGENLRFIEKWGCWIVWDGARWREASDIALLPLARRVTEEMMKWAVNRNSDREAWIKHALATQRDARLRAMINLAKGEAVLRIQPDALDADAWLLGCPNGTLDLRTGKLRKARREDYITRQISAPLDPAAECPHWTRFLNWAAEGDAELVEFVQTFVGYALTGEVCEEKMCAFVGDGANGKSTFLMTLHDLFGDYGGKVRSDLLVHGQGKEGAPSPDIAALHGKRLVIASETEDGCSLSEARIKDIVSNEVIAARRLHRDPFTFRPTHKIILETNHPPHVRGTDAGIWRRLAMVRFSAAIEEDRKVADFREKFLRPELPGILNWAVQGVMRWKRNGLRLPTSVRKATDEYRSAMDTVAQWIEERTEGDMTSIVPVNSLHNDYVSYLGPHGHPFGRRRFSEELERKGYAADKLTGGVRARRGLKLTPLGAMAQLKVVR